MMKLIIVLLTAGFLQVQAAAFGQNVTLSGRDIPLDKVFGIIREQTGFGIFGNASLLKMAKPVTVDSRQVPLKDFLDEILKDQPLAYRIEGKTIVLSRKTTPPYFAVAPADITLTGQVTDRARVPLTGASIRVKGSKNGVLTDGSGNFSIKVAEGDVLIVSYIGFQDLTFKISDGVAVLNSGQQGAVSKSGSGFLIQLQPAETQLNEIVVNKGYYTESKRLSTGSVGSVSSAEIARQPVSNPLQALYAKVPGLVITQQTGVAGGNFKIEIRGQNSLRNLAHDNGNIPLFIVDGAPFNSASLSNPSVTGLLYPAGGLVAPGISPFNMINPGDIASIEILKDADATSIYGSRGANGVILITTKRGTASEMTVDANVYTGAGKVTRRMDVLRTQQYLEMRKEAYRNDGVTAYPSNAYDVNGAWDQNAYTDWQKELIGGTANITDAQLSVSGGTAFSKYRFGGGYHKETTVFPGDFADRRATAHLSLSNASPNQKFTSHISVNYAYGKTNLSSRDLVAEALGLAPNHPALVNGDGNLHWAEDGQNPLMYLKKPYKATSHTLIANGDIGYKILPNLMIKTNMGGMISTRKEMRKEPINSNNPAYQQYYTHSTTFGNAVSTSWILEPQLTYHLNKGIHTLDVIVGSTFQDQTMESTSQMASGFTSEALMENIGAVSNNNIYTSYTTSLYRYNAIFGRVSYNYDSKYILNLTGRRDGSSRFGPGKQFANFGSAGIAWIFSREHFAERMKFLSFGKLRGSYGTTGSDQISDYGYLDLYSPSYQYGGVSGLGPRQLLNPEYAWETNRKFEAAMELGFLKDRITMTAAYYHNRSSNQLVGYPLPPSAGFESVQSNLDAVVQNTGFELEVSGRLSARLSARSGFNWDLSFNLSVPRNKLVSYPNLEGSSFIRRYTVGQPLNISKLFEYVQVDPATGLYEVVDQNKDGLYDAKDMETVAFLGPKVMGGLQNSFQYKGLQLDILFQFVKQNGGSLLYYFQLPGMMANQPAYVMNRWQKPGDIAPVQRFSNSRYTEWDRFQSSTGSIMDASFIRLKNLSLSYRLPAAWSSSLRLKQVRCYVQGQNLLTLTKYPGLDPETQGLVLPPLRFLTGGIQITL